MSYIDTKDYLPYGPIPVDAPTVSEIVSEWSDYIDTYNVDERFMENMMKSIVNSLYREYYINGNRSIVIKYIRVNPIGMAEIDISSRPEETDFGKTLQNLIEMMQEYLLSYPNKAKFMKPSFIKTSRYIWNYSDPVVNTSDIIIEVIQNVARAYANTSALSHLPTAFSVFTIKSDGTYEEELLRSYLAYSADELEPQLIEKGLIKDEKELDDILQKEFDPEIVSFIKFHMITEFMTELNKRITKFVPAFPVEILNQFFVQKNWDKSNRFHTIIYYGMNLEKPNLWRIKEELGSGTYGSVYETCRVLDCNYVMKFQGESNYDSINANIEIDMMRKAYNIGVAPKLVAYYVDDQYALLIMERMKTTLDDVLKHHRDMSPVEFVNLMNSVVDLVETLHDGGIVHCDLHFGNIMLNTSYSSIRTKLFHGNIRNELKLIDFGFASDIEKNEEMPDEMYDFYETKGIINKLKNLKCNLNTELFPLLKFYDYSKLITDINKYMTTGAEVVIQRIIKKQADLRTGCGKETKLRTRKKVDEATKATAEAITWFQGNAKGKSKNEQIDMFLNKVLGPTLYIIYVNPRTKLRTVVLDKIDEFLDTLENEPSKGTERQIRLLTTIKNSIKSDTWNFIFSDAEPVFQRVKQKWFMEFQ